MKATKRKKVKHMLTALGPTLLQRTQPGAFQKGFWRPVQVAGKHRVPSLRCPSQVTHYPLDIQKEGRVLLREGSCEKQALEIEAEVPKLQP